MIGRTGLEAAYEDQLRAEDGVAINIVDANGAVIEELARQDAQDGQDVRTTIDMTAQQAAYDQFKDDRGVAAAMDPTTGEILALVSAPAMIQMNLSWDCRMRGWNELNNSEDMPLNNRFVSTWVPGSTFKGITAAIGVDSGKIDPAANLGYVGLSWQKDASWGDYYVTTLTDYGENVNLEMHSCIRIIFISPGQH